MALNFPGVEVRSVSPRYHRDEPYVVFEVPGASQGIGWEVGSGFVEVAPIDLHAWKAYEGVKLMPIGAWESEGGAIL